jgi:hypothetical protein
MAVVISCDANVYRGLYGSAAAAPSARKRRATGSEGGGRAGRAHQGGDVSYASALVCDSPAGVWLRHSHDSGASRALECDDYDGVYARAESRRSGREEPAGQPGLGRRRSPVFAYPELDNSVSRCGALRGKFYSSNRTEAVRRSGGSLLPSGRRSSVAGYYLLARHGARFIKNGSEMSV